MMQRLCFLCCLQMQRRRPQCNVLIFSYQWYFSFNGKTFLRQGRVSKRIFFVKNNTSDWIKHPSVFFLKSYENQKIWCFFPNFQVRYRHSLPLNLHNSLQLKVCWAENLCIYLYPVLLGVKKWNFHDIKTFFANFLLV